MPDVWRRNKGIRRVMLGEGGDDLCGDENDGDVREESKRSKTSRKTRRSFLHFTLP